MRRHFLLCILCFCLSACTFMPSPGGNPTGDPSETETVVSPPPADFSPTPATAPPEPSVTPDSATESEPPAAPEPVRVAFTGDVLLYGRMAEHYAQEGADAILDPALAARLSGMDVTVANLEMAVSLRGSPLENKQFTFRGNPSDMPFLSETMGVDAVSLANNHTLDYGRDAFLDTMDTLRENGIGYVGAGRTLDEALTPWITEVCGRRIALLAASRVIPAMDWYAGPNSPGVAGTYDPALLNAAITAAKETCDIVLVYVHWGIELNTLPEDYQRALARGYIDAGADAVIGSHPHVLQGFEFYNGKPIAYSLGNFVFTTSRAETCAAVLHIAEDALTLQVVPCTIKSPNTALVTDAEVVTERLRQLEAISFDVYFDEDGVLQPLAG